jgi:hypothetical protein
MILRLDCCKCDRRILKGGGELRFDGENATWLLKPCGVKSICLEKLNTQEMDTRVKNSKCDSNIQQIENFGSAHFTSVLMGFAICRR